MTEPEHAFEARRAALEAELGEPITLDGLTATLRIFQRKKGHRHSTDDLLTAWYAIEKSPPVARAIDLGAGLGSVGLLVLSVMPLSMCLTCIEAQAVSFRFLNENVRANHLESRVTMHHGDLRTFESDETFPLVTGSPPYFDVSAGIVPADSQKAHARFELRGDVRDYARAAKRLLTRAPGEGLFVFCFPWAQKARALEAIHAEGFALRAHRDVIPRAGLVPLFSLFACRHATPGDEGARDVAASLEPPLVVREATGEHTAMMRSVRARFGFG